MFETLNHMIQILQLLKKHPTQLYWKTDKGLVFINVHTSWSLRSIKKIKQLKLNKSLL